MKIKLCALILSLTFLLSSFSACAAKNSGAGADTTGADDIPTIESTSKVTESNDTAPESTPDETDGAVETEPAETEAQEEPDHPLSGKLVINEICSSNKTLLADARGEYPDWLEIMNTSSETIQLSGIGLSKKEDEPYALTMPKMTLAPGAFMVVFCDKKADAGYHNSNLYAPFNIGADGETIYLTAAQENGKKGALLDVVTVPKIKSDNVYARTQDGAGQFTVMTATPERSNRSATQITYISEPTFSQESGFYSKEFALSIKANGGTVYYTTDCSDPTTSESREVLRGEINISDATKNPNVASAVTDIALGTTVTAPVEPVDKCTVIRAAAIDRDGYASEVVTKVYFVGKTAEVYKDYAVVSVSADYRDFFSSSKGIYVIGDAYYDWLKSPDYVEYNAADKRNPANYNQDGREWEREVAFTYFENGKPVYGTDCGVRIAGNWSRQARQKSLRLYARSEYGDGKFDYAFFGDIRGTDGKVIDQFDKLTLSNGGNDWWQTKMTNTVISNAVADTNVDVMETKPCILFLNGEFWGLYFLSEKQEDEHFESHYGVKAENITVIKNGLTEGSNDVVKQYKKLMNNLLKADISDPEVYRQFSELIDFDSLIDYIAVQTYIVNTDWSKETSLNNWMMWRSNTVDPSNPYADGKWRFALFDVDAGAKQDVATNLLSQMNKQEKWQSFSTIFYKLCQNPEFNNKFYERAKEIIEINFATDRMNNIIDGYVAQCRDMVEKTYTRFCFNGNYTEKLTKMQRFYANRPAYALQFLREFCGK